MSAASATEPYLDAAEAFADLVDRLPAALPGPGLGAWDLRALAGHTSRALITVSSYLAEPEPDAVTLDSAAAYVAGLAEAANDDAGVVERGRVAGEALGAEPAVAVRRLLEQVADDLVAAPPDRLVSTYGGGMRLGDYLPTRTFELVVHGLDIADATGLDWTPPEDALTEAAMLTAEVALRRGEGVRFLRAVTGRPGPPYSIV